MRFGETEARKTDERVSVKVLHKEAFKIFLGLVGSPYTQTQNGRHYKGRRSPVP